MDREEWCTRLAVCAGVIDDLMVGYWLEHDALCPAIDGHACDCQLVAMFTTERAVIAVDGTLAVAQAARH